MLAELDDAVPDELQASNMLARGQLVVRRDERRNDPWMVYWETSQPDAHLDFRQGNTLAAGLVTDHLGWPSSWSRPHEVLRDADGNPVPEINAQGLLSEWQQTYRQALTSFVLAGLLKAPSPVELVARLSNRDPELPSTRRLVDRFASRTRPSVHTADLGTTVQRPRRGPAGG